MGWKERARRSRAAADASTAMRRLRAAWDGLTPVQRAQFLAELAERRAERDVTRPPAWEPMAGYDPEPLSSVYAETVAAQGLDPLRAALKSPTELVPILSAPWGER